MVQGSRDFSCDPGIRNFVMTFFPDEFEQKDKVQCSGHNDKRISTGKSGHNNC